MNHGHSDLVEWRDFGDEGAGRANRQITPIKTETPIRAAGGITGYAWQPTYVIFAPSCSYLLTTVEGSVGE